MAPVCFSRLNDCLNDCPIPFCGGKAIHSLHKLYVCCSRCGFKGPVNDRNGDLWNSLRPPDQIKHITASACDSVVKPTLELQCFVYPQHSPISKVVCQECFDSALSRNACEGCHDTGWISEPDGGGECYCKIGKALRAFNVERRLADSLFCGTVWYVRWSDYGVDDSEDGPYSTRSDAELAYRPKPGLRYEEVGVIGQRQTQLQDSLTKERARVSTLEEENKRLCKTVQDLEYDKTRCDECIYHPNSEHRCYTDAPYKVPQILLAAEKLIAKLGASSHLWVADVCNLVNLIVQHLKNHDEARYAEQLRLEGWEEADQKRLERLEALEKKVHELENSK